jgi:hypothetical protein
MDDNYGEEDEDELIDEDFGEEPTPHLERVS